jgi:two-component system response regulator LytT
MKAVVFEDEPFAAKALVSLINEVSPECEVLAVLESVSQGERFWKKNPQVDVVFMDLHLSDDIGFAFLNKIDPGCPVVFVTAYDQYALKAFEYNSVDYLLKPIEPAALKRALEKLKNRQPQFEAALNQGWMKGVEEGKAYRERFVVAKADRMMWILASEVCCFYSQGGMTQLITKQGVKWEVPFSLGQLEEQLNPSCFFRVNRNFIVRKDAVVEVKFWFTRRYKITLQAQTEEDVIVSRERVSAFLKWMQND